MEKPYIVCHMLTSLDGKIDGAYMGMPECAPALAAYGELRKFYHCQATLYGTTTMAGGYADGLIGRLPAAGPVYPKEDYIAARDAENFIISLDPQGVLQFHSSWIEKKGRPRAHVVEVLTQAVAGEYLAYLRGLGISYLFAGENRLDCALLLQKLYGQLNIIRLMVAGGGLTNWSFAQAHLLDEVSVVVAPVADGGRTSATIFEEDGQLHGTGAAAFHLKKATALEKDVLWLRYTLA